MQGTQSTPALCSAANAAAAAAAGSLLSCGTGAAGRAPPWRILIQYSRHLAT